jgi:hypothetical protein
MKFIVHDPFPHHPSTPTNVNVCAFTRDVSMRAFGYIEGSTQMDARRVKYVGKGTKRVRRISYR